MTVMSMPALPDCPRCGAPMVLRIGDHEQAMEECVSCPTSHPPVPPRVDRREIRAAVRESRRRLLGPSCFGRRHHLCKASGCRWPLPRQDEEEAVKVDVMITQVTVSALPEDNINHGAYAVTVDYRGDGRWAVLHRGWCLSRDGRWDYEIRPSDREDGWLDAHRFTYEEALALAAAEAPGIVVNGIKAAEVAVRAQA